MTNETDQTKEGACACGKKGCAVCEPALMLECLPIAPSINSNERVWALLAVPSSAKALAGLLEHAPRGAVVRNGAQLFREGSFVQTIEVVVFAKGGANV